MRLKEDDSSWRAGGIKRRDFRHDPGTPETEVSKHTHGKGANKKSPRKRIDHKHVWVEHESGYERYYWHEMWKNDPPPEWRFSFDCAVPGCDARKSKKNPRYGYENWKWRRRQNR